MSTDPTRRDDDPAAEPAGGERYGFADPEPPPRPVSLPPTDDPPAADEHEISLEEETRPKKRRRKRRRDEAGEGDAGAEPGEDLEPLPEREEEPPAMPWWAVPAVIFVIGVVLCLVPIGMRAAEAGASAGAGLFGLLVVALFVQLAAMAGLLVAVGHLFGIDYGPAAEALLKLAAVVAVIDGLTAVFFTLSAPCGLMVAALVGAGVFQYLFRLSMHEMLLTVAPMVGAAWVLNFVVFAILADKARKKDDTSGIRLPGGGIMVTVDASATTLPLGSKLIPPIRTPASRRSPPCSPSGVARSGSATVSAVETSSPSARSGPA
jgi:hypothetical protein